jgi:putative DNA primase/helicase
MDRAKVNGSRQTRNSDHRRDWIAQARAVRIEGEIARRGIKLAGRVERCGPCPVCGGTDRFAINIEKQAWNCRGCQRGGDVITLVKHLDRCNFTTALETLTGQARQQAIRPPAAAKTSVRTDVHGAADYEARQARKAAWLWSQRQPIAGTPAEAYLRGARRYSGLIPRTLAFLPPSKPKHHPAMIAAFGIPDEPERGIISKPRDADAVHLTLLRPDGGGKADVKPNKLIIGRPLGRPIVIAPTNDLLGLAITEGIEDALSAHEATGLGAWAAGAAGFMPVLAAAVPSYIEAVTVYAHEDKAGQAGAHELAEALDHRGIEIRLEGLGQ